MVCYDIRMGFPSIHPSLLPYSNTMDTPEPVNCNEFTVDVIPDVECSDQQFTADVIPNQKDSDDQLTLIRIPEQNCSNIIISNPEHISLDELIPKQNVNITRGKRTRCKNDTFTAPKCSPNYCNNKIRNKTKNIRTSKGDITKPIKPLIRVLPIKPPTVVRPRDLSNPKLPQATKKKSTKTYSPKPRDNMIHKPKPVRYYTPPPIVKPLFPGVVWPRHTFLSTSSAATNISHPSKQSTNKKQVKNFKNNKVVISPLQFHEMTQSTKYFPDPIIVSQVISNCHESYEIPIVDEVDDDDDLWTIPFPKNIHSSGTSEPIISSSTSLTPLDQSGKVFVWGKDENDCDDVDESQQTIQEQVEQILDMHRPHKNKNIDSSTKSDNFKIPLHTNISDTCASSQDALSDDEGFWETPHPKKTFPMKNISTKNQNHAHKHNPKTHQKNKPNKKDTRRPNNPTTCITNSNTQVSSMSKIFSDIGLVTEVCTSSGTDKLRPNVFDHSDHVLFPDLTRMSLKCKSKKQNKISVPPQNQKKDAPELIVPKKSFAKQPSIKKIIGTVCDCERGVCVCGLSNVNSRSVESNRGVSVSSNIKSHHSKSACLKSIKSPSSVHSKWIPGTAHMHQWSMNESDRSPNWLWTTDPWQFAQNNKHKKNNNNISK